jgi:hypothetical protein
MRKIRPPPPTTTPMMMAFFLELLPAREYIRS